MFTRDACASRGVGTFAPLQARRDTTGSATGEHVSIRRGRDRSPFLPGLECNSGAETHQKSLGTPGARPLSRLPAYIAINAQSEK